MSGSNRNNRLNRKPIPIDDLVIEKNITINENAVIKGNLIVHGDNITSKDGESVDIIKEINEIKEKTDVLDANVIMKREINQLKQQTSTLHTNLKTESERFDENIKKEMENAQTSRESMNDELHDKIDNEITRAKNAEKELSEKIDDETRMRKLVTCNNADNIEINKNNIAKNAADISKNADAISGETKRAKKAETDNATAISKNADAIQTETDRAKAAEKKNAADISKNADAISGETKRAKKAETDNATAISKNADAIQTETDRAKAAEKKNADNISKNASAIQTETDRAKAAEDFNRINVLEDEPNEPELDDKLYINSDENILYRYDGEKSVWIAVGGSSSGNTVLEPDGDENDAVSFTIKWKPVKQSVVSFSNRKMPEILSINYKVSEVNQQTTEVFYGNKDFTIPPYYDENNVDHNRIKFSTTDSPNPIKSETEYSVEVWIQNSSITSYNDANNADLITTYDNLQTATVGLPSSVTNVRAGDIITTTTHDILWSTPEYNNLNNTKTPDLPAIDKYRLNLEATETKSVAEPESERSFEIIPESGWRTNNEDINPPYTITDLYAGTTYDVYVQVKNVTNNTDGDEGYTPDPINNDVKTTLTTNTPPRPSIDIPDIVIHNTSNIKPHSGIQIGNSNNVNVFNTDVNTPEKSIKTTLINVLSTLPSDPYSQDDTTKGQTGNFYIYIGEHAESISYTVPPAILNDWGSVLTPPESEAESDAIQFINFGNVDTWWPNAITPYETNYWRGVKIQTQTTNNLNLTAGITNYCISYKREFIGEAEPEPDVETQYLFNIDDTGDPNILATYIEDNSEDNSEDKPSPAYKSGVAVINSNTSFTIRIIAENLGNYFIRSDKEHARISNSLNDTVYGANTDIKQDGTPIYYNYDSNVSSHIETQDGGADDPFGTSYSATTDKSSRNTQDSGWQFTGFKKTYVILAPENKYRELQLTCKVVNIFTNNLNNQDQTLVNIVNGKFIIDTYSSDIEQFRKVSNDGTGGLPFPNRLGLGDPEPEPYDNSVSLVSSEEGKESYRFELQYKKNGYFYPETRDYTNTDYYFPGFNYTNFTGIKYAMFELSWPSKSGTFNTFNLNILPLQFAQKITSLYFKVAGVSDNYNTYWRNVMNPAPASGISDNQIGDGDGGYTGGFPATPGTIGSTSPCTVITGTPKSAKIYVRIGIPDSVPTHIGLTNITLSE